MKLALSFVHLDQSPIGSCGLPWAKTTAAPNGLCVPRVRCCFGARGPQRPIGRWSKWTKLKSFSVPWGQVKSSNEALSFVQRFLYLIQLQSFQITCCLFAKTLHFVTFLKNRCIVLFRDLWWLWNVFSNVDLGNDFLKLFKSVRPSILFLFRP